MKNRLRPRLRLLLRAARAVALIAALAGLLGGPSAGTAAAITYTPVSGAGSTWAYNAVDQWRRDVQQYGMQINFAGTGSSDGRQQFLNGTVDFAVSDIPFQTHPTDGSAPEHPVTGSYAYMPIVAGGTAFMYHLTIGGKQVDNLRLSGETLSKIFTGVITRWNDPAVAADNPGLRLPAESIVPVVRSDGSGSSAQLSLWMMKQYPALWDSYCARVGRSGECGETSYYPTVTGMIAQSGDLGVAGYIAQGYGEGSIGYVNYSYALNEHFPVAKILNPAGYYTEPTASNVAVSLLKAQINEDASSPDYLTQELDSVYTDPDPRTYVLSSYSYMILPLKVQGTFTSAKGMTLAAFAYYFMCQGQQQAPALGYSPLPINLVQAGFEQIRKIPGVQAQNINIKNCNNPTFSSSGVNELASTAPYPPTCDKQGAAPCDTGSGGASTSGSGTTGGSGGTSGSGSTGTTGTVASTGSTGTAGTTGTGTATGAGAAGGTGSGGTVDPDTGQVVNSSAKNGNGSGTVLAEPVAVAAPSGWSSTQTLMLLAAFTLLLLILAPAATARLLGARNPGGNSASGNNSTGGSDSSGSGGQR